MASVAFRGGLTAGRSHISSMTGRRSFLLLIPLLALVAALQLRADRASSVTFDELVLIGEGVRVVEVGARGMVVEQPPLMPLLYGTAAAPFVRGVPDEASAEWGFRTRWRWGRELLFSSGNDPRAVATAARSVGMVATLLLLVLVFATGRAIAGPGTGLLAAALTGLHPEVLTHGAVAYNDLPLALAFLAALVAMDAAVRRPAVGSGALAGLALALAFGVKYSALALLPVGALLIAAEAAERGRDRGWWLALARAGGLAAATFWATTALLHGADLFLSGLRFGLALTIERAQVGHPAPAWLFGATSQEGFRLFFPIAWFVKTPLALQVATLLGLGFLLRSARRFLASPLRAPAIGLLVFAAFLAASSQNVGLRYALPAIPLLALLAAAGWARVPGHAPRLASGALVLATAVVVTASGPILVSFRSAWTGWRDGPPALLDSSVDWGQGLLALRGWMEENDVPAVRLSYFGSGLPEGYGIEYVPLRSFLPLRPVPTPGVRTAPEWTAISITNLHGLYFEGDDPFAEYRARRPDAIVGGSIHLYRAPSDDAPTPPPTP